MIANNKVAVTYLNTEDMISDMLTKPLELKSFLKHRDNLLGNHKVFFQQILNNGESKVVHGTKLAFFASSSAYTCYLNKIS